MLLVVHEVKSAHSLCVFGELAIVLKNCKPTWLILCIYMNLWVPEEGLASGGGGAGFTVADLFLMVGLTPL